MKCFSVVFTLFLGHLVVVSSKESAASFEVDSFEEDLQNVEDGIQALRGVILPHPSNSAHRFNLRHLVELASFSWSDSDFDLTFEDISPSEAAETLFCMRDCLDGTPKSPCDDGPSPSTDPTTTFQDFNTVVYGQTNTLEDESSVKTALIGFDEENDGMIALLNKNPVYTDNVKIKKIPGYDGKRLRVQFSIWTYGGVTFEIEQQYKAIEDGTLFTPEILLFDVGNVFNAPIPGQPAPYQDGIDIGRPWKPAEDPDTAHVTWWYPNGTSNDENIPNVLSMLDADPNSMEIQYFLSLYEHGEAIGFTIVEDIILI